MTLNKLLPWSISSVWLKRVVGLSVNFRKSWAACLKVCIFLCPLISSPTPNLEIIKQESAYLNKNEVSVGVLWVYSMFDVFAEGDSVTATGDKSAWYRCHARRAQCSAGDRGPELWHVSVKLMHSVYTQYILEISQTARGSWVG